MSGIITIEQLEERAASLGLRVGFAFVSPPVGSEAPVSYTFDTREEGDLLLAGMELYRAGFVPLQEALLAAACETPPITPSAAAGEARKAARLEAVREIGAMEAEKARALEALGGAVLDGGADVEDGRPSAREDAAAAARAGIDPARLTSQESPFTVVDGAAGRQDAGAPSGKPVRVQPRQTMRRPALGGVLGKLPNLMAAKPKVAAEEETTNAPA